MSPLDAFYSAWSQARETFGQGAPQDGTRFDGSSQLLRFQERVRATAPDDRWQGPASSSYATKNQDHAAVYGSLAGLDKRMAAEVTNAAKVVTTGRQNLDQLKVWVDSTAQSIPKELNATDRDTKLTSIASQRLGKLQNIISDSHKNMSTIAGRMNALTGEYQALGNNTPEEKKPHILTAWNDRTSDSDLQPEDMEGLVHDALDGNQEAAAKVDKILKSINQDQLGSSSIQHPLSPVQAELIGQMQAQMKKMSLDDLNTARDKLGPHKSILANAMQVMSDPDVRYPRHDKNGPQVVIPGQIPNYGILPGDTGALPDDVQYALAHADDVGHTTGPDVQKYFAQGKDLDKIAALVQDSDPRFQHGTELDRQLLVAADKQMDRIAHDPLLRGDTGTLQNILGAVDDDHQIVNDHLMGRDGRSADNFLHNLNTIEWTDDGRAAGHLFSWTGDEHVVNGPEAHLAAETADKYAEYLGDPTNRQALLHIGGQTLGQLNPELVRGYAAGLVPYVDDMAGEAGAGGPFEIDDGESRDQGLMPHAKGVFSILNTDAQAAEMINQEAYRLAMQHEAAFAANPTDPTSAAHLYAAATMRGLVDIGTHEAFEAFKDNGYQSEKDETQWKKRGFDAAVAAFSAAGSAGASTIPLPGTGPITGIAISQIGSIFSDQLFGSTSAPEHLPLPHAADSMYQHALLEAMIAAGQDLKLPAGYVKDGHIVRPEGVLDSDYNVALAQEFARMTTMVGDDDPASFYVKRYNNMIQDPDITPNKKR